MDTPFIWASAVAFPNPADAVAEAGRKTVLKRLGAAEDVAHAALFLASDESSFVTGILLTADGGLTLQSPEALVRPSIRARWRSDVLVPQERPAGPQPDDDDM